MNNTSYKKGDRFEKKIYRTISSGKIWFDKGDLKDADYLIECKYTDKKGFRVSLKHLEKLWNQALTKQKEPRLVIGIRRNENEIFVLTSDVRLERK